MSIFLSDAAVIEFDSMVKHEYQGSSTLRDSVTLRTGVVGESYKFAAMGKGIAQQKATQAAVTPADVTHSRPTANLENWYFAEYTDIFDQAEVNYSEQRELAQTAAKAIGRRDDQLIIDAMQAGATQDIAAAGANLTKDKVIAASRILNDQGVPMSERCFVTTAAGLEAMLKVDEVVNADYAAIRALISGELDTWMGFKWKMIENRVGAEGGLPITGDIHSGFAYHKAAVGHAVAIDNRTNISYENPNTSWLIVSTHKAGSVARDADGIVRVNYDVTA